MNPQYVLRFGFVLLGVLMSAVNLSAVNARCDDAVVPVAGPIVGPIVGTIDFTTAHLLYRPGTDTQTLRLSVLDAQNQVVATVQTEATSSSDWVAKFVVQGLQPATTYRYQIETVGDAPKMLAPANDRHTFTTADPSRAGRSVRVSFVSCVDIEPSEIWDEMDSLEVDTVCLMGDTPYIDNVDLNVVRNRHRMFLQIPELASLATHTPTIGVWDDHDFGLNNGNGMNMLEGKATTRQGFVEYRSHSQYGNGREGVYHKVDLGMIEIFLLDPRYFSQTGPSPVDPEQTTCFGTDQWQWLLAGLKQSKAPFKVLACGGIWQDKKNSETDDMFTYWYERDALLDFIQDEQISGVTLLGGDIHVARHLVHPQRVGYDLHDFIISPGHARTITSLDVYHPSLQWSLVEGWQFLTLTADGTTDEPRLIAEYRQPGGKVNRRVEVSLSELTPSPQPSGLRRDLRAVWHFDDGFQNDSILGKRINAIPAGDASIAPNVGISGSSARFHRDQQSYLNVPRSFLDDNSDQHTVSLWFRPETLPAPSSNERQFLIESTAEGEPSDKRAWHLSLGLRAAGGNAEQVNLQLYTNTLAPAPPQAAPSTISQGPFDWLVDRDQIAGKWNHLLFTFDSHQLNLYLNGRLVAENQLPIPGPAAEFGGLIIGGHRAGAGRNFDGWIDEVAVWQRVLGPNEVESVFRQKRIQ